MRIFNGKERDPEAVAPAFTTWLEAPRWNAAYKPWGDRLDFLSPEKQHLETGKLRILPPREDRKRDGR